MDVIVTIRPSSISLVYPVYYISIPNILSIILWIYASKYNHYGSNMVSTMKIGDETKKSLLKIGAGFTLKDGKERSLEDIVKILIEEHKLKQKWNISIKVIRVCKAKD